MLHAHISQSSRDCDGDYSSGYVLTLSHEESTAPFGELAFMDRVMLSLTRPRTMAELRVSLLGLEWHEDTEEGFVRTSVTWCEDDCTIPAPWQRDHRAEAAGY